MRDKIIVGGLYRPLFILAKNNTTYKVLRALPFPNTAVIYDTAGDRRNTRHEMRLLEFFRLVSKCEK